VGHADDDIQPSEGCVPDVWENAGVEMDIQLRMSGRAHWESGRQVGVSNSCGTERIKAAEDAGRTLVVRGTVILIMIDRSNWT
jgi:hypothetical protein